MAAFAPPPARGSGRQASRRGAGAFLISPVLEFSLISSDSLALLPDVLRLPSYAAVLLERSGAPTPTPWPRSSASRSAPTSPRSPPRRATRR
jgi:hypothetical protein